MTNPQFTAFQQFVTRFEKKLKLIAAHSKSAYEDTDVANEIWLIAQDLTESRGIIADFLNPSFQDLVLSHAYQRLVRYEEKNIRHAVQIDHPKKGSDEEDEPHPLMRTLVADEGRDPLAELIAREEAASRKQEELDAHLSLASAYVCLLGHLGNRMRPVADHLLISISYAYRQFARAKMLAECQQPAPMSVIHRGYIPGPWRRFRLYRAPVQLAFDFDDELPLSLPFPSLGK